MVAKKRTGNSGAAPSPAAAAAAAAVPLEPISQESILTSTKTNVNRLYHEIVNPIGDRFHFKSGPSQGEIMSRPMVVFMGNHSSGKSHFINFLLGNEVQMCGTAPLDDGFTLLTYGERADEQDGPAVVSNKQLPFGSLLTVGESFAQRLKMKMMPHPLLKEVTLVDSPGMIDSMGEGRGYDFMGVIRWFVERADYVLFFFDPDKPGTTGESLKVFTECLGGIEHKLLILMNKVDIFKSIGDFTRAYGTLCWNLAKVIPFKDMPYLYTTYVPQANQQDTQRSWSLAEFDKSRNSIVKKVKSAPNRHADNLVTDLCKHTEQMLVYTRVMTAARRQLWWYRLSLWFFVLLVFGFAAAAGVHFLELANETTLTSKSAMFGSSLLLLLALVFAVLVPYLVRSKEESIVADFQHLFERIYSKELMKDTEMVTPLWASVRTSAAIVARKFGLLSFRPLSRKEEALLNGIVQDEVQQMLELVHRGVSSARGMQAESK